MPINPTDLIGLKCSFDHDGNRLAGIIDAAEPNGFAEPGHIPDILVTVRGTSGRTLKVSLVESYMTLSDR